MSNYQYVVVKMPGISADEEAWTERLNSVAEQGWRLVTITTKEFKGGGMSAYATFEREV